MNRFKSAIGLIAGVAVMAVAFVPFGCSSEDTASVEKGGATSKRDEAGKKFPFPDASSTPKGAAGSPKNR
jgi:hypothetical protein